MNTMKLAYFLRVADYRSFSEAAKALYISQPSLSQSIALLETEIGAKLFNRNVTPLTLTDEGTVFYDYAMEVLKSEQTMSRRISDIQDGKTGSLTISMTRMRSAHLLPNLLPIFQSKYPDVKFRILDDPGQNYVDQVVKGQSDFALVSRLEKHPKLNYIALADQEILLCIPPNHILAKEANGIYNWHKRPCFDLQRLKNEQFILSADPHFNTRIYRIFHHAGFSPDIYTTIEDWRTLHLLAIHNLGFTFTYDAAAIADFGSIQTIYYRLDCDDSKSHLYICYRKDAYLSKMMNDFIDMMKSIIISTYSLPDKLK